MRVILSDLEWNQLRLEEFDRSKLLLDNTTKYKKKPTAHHQEEHLHVLYSYFYAKKTGVKVKKDNMKVFRDNKIKGDIYIDSGVFTSRKTGDIITVEDLTKFYYENEEIVDWMFTLDIGDGPEQLENCRRMKENGVPVIGIWHGNKHGNMPLDYIDRFIDINPYISVGMPFKEEGIEYLDRFWEYIYKRNLFPVKVHLLGVETPSVLLRYPFYSVDSSTFAKAYAFGRCSYFDKRKLKIANYHPGEDWKKAFKMDITSMKYIGGGSETRNHRVKNNIVSRFDYQKYLTEVWENRGVVWED